MANAIPTIVFQVDLSYVNQIGFLNPDMYTENPDIGRANIAQKATERRTLIPGLFPGNMYELMHGAQFTEYGAKANYLKNTYGPGSSQPILLVISESYIQD